MGLDVRLTENKCCHCGRGDVVFKSNITHNLTEMAEAAGLYKILWRPEEEGIKTAKQLIEPLTRGLETLLAKSIVFKQYNSSNGYGSYDELCRFVQRYLNACKECPEANVEASR